MTRTENTAGHAPADPYSPLWASYWAAHPGAHRSVGSAAAEEVVADAAAVEAPAGTGDSGAAAAEPAATAAPSAPAAPEDWRADLPDDLRKVADRFTSKADAIRAIADLRKRESQARVPGKNASEEEVAAYRKAVGIPDAPEGYEFPTADGQDVTPEIEAARGEWAKTFHELGVPKDTAAKLIERVRAESEQQLAAQVQADKSYAKEQEAALRAEWKGDEFDKNKTLANRAFTDVANRAGVTATELTQIETKDGRFLLDDARMVRVFAAIGREMAEGTLSPALNDSERDTVENEVADVRRQIGEAQSAGDSQKANRLYQREQALIAKMGNRSIVGAGRSA